jgi:hypothetical protein
MFLRADRFSRPLARVLKNIDTEINKLDNGTTAVAIWLTDDATKTKNYLPLVQQSLKFDDTTLAYIEHKEQHGPESWGINPDADLTVVVIEKGKVTQRFGFVAPNEKATKKLTEILDSKKDKAEKKSADEEKEKKKDKEEKKEVKSDEKKSS